MTAQPAAPEQLAGHLRRAEPSQLGGWTSICTQNRLLFSLPVPILAPLFNRWLAPLMQWFCLTIFMVAQADECGCKIVTVPHDILSKAAKMLGMDLTALSLDTVKMFAKDAAAAGFKL